MTDTFSKEKRSWIMAQVKSKGTSPELAFRKLLFKQGIRYKLSYKLQGKPDVVLPSKRIAVFIDGCFWHGCPKCFRAPRSNKRYWKPKIQRNIERDKKHTKELKFQGWKVLRFWEHQIKGNPQKVIKRIKSALY